MASCRSTSYYCRCSSRRLWPAQPSYSWRPNFVKPWELWASANSFSIFSRKLSSFICNKLIPVQFQLISHVKMRILLKILFSWFMPFFNMFAHLVLNDFKFSFVFQCWHWSSEKIEKSSHLASNILIQKPIISLPKVQIKWANMLKILMNQKANDFSKLLYSWSYILWVLLNDIFTSNT